MSSLKKQLRSQESSRRYRKRKKVRHHVSLRVVPSAFSDLCGLHQDVFEQQREHATQLESELHRVRGIYYDGHTLAPQVRDLRANITAQELAFKDNLQCLKRATAQEVDMVGQRRRSLLLLSISRVPLLP